MSSLSLLRTSFKKAFCFSNIWLWEEELQVFIIIRCHLISKDDKNGQYSTWAPCNRRVDGKVVVKTHDSHPAEHGHGEEVSNVTNNCAEGGGEMEDVIGQEQIGGEKEDGEDITENNFAMKII